MEVCWKCGTSVDGELAPTFKKAERLRPGDTEEMECLGLGDIEPKGTDCDLPPLLLRMGPKTIAVIASVCVLIAAYCYWEHLPKTASEFGNLALEHMIAKEYTEAIDDATRAIEIMEREPDERYDRGADFYALRGLAYNNNLEFDKAVADLDIAVERVSPVELGTLKLRQPGEESLPRYRLLRGLALMNGDHRERAREDLQWVLDNDPHNEQAKIWLASLE